MTRLLRLSGARIILFQLVLFCASGAVVRPFHDGRFDAGITSSSPVATPARPRKSDHYFGPDKTIADECIALTYPVIIARQWRAICCSS